MPHIFHPVVTSVRISTYLVESGEREEVVFVAVRTVICGVKNKSLSREN